MWNLIYGDSGGCVGLGVMLEVNFIGDGRMDGFHADGGEVEKRGGNTGLEKTMQGKRECTLVRGVKIQ